MITKGQIILFLDEKRIEWKYTEEKNIVTRDIIYFIYDDRFLCDIGINTLPDYQNWEN